VRRVCRLVLAGAALAALAVPAAAVAQSGAPRLTEEPTSGFPDKVYLLQLPQSRPLSGLQVDVSENGGSVVGLGIEEPGGKTSAAVLLIDASDSMRGAAISGAMAATRQFLAERKPNLPVAIVTFGPSTTVLSEFTTEREELAAAVASNPPLNEGTHIYDALLRVAELVEDEGVGRTNIVLLSDGTDVGSTASREEALAALDRVNGRVISVGLRSEQYNPEALRSLAGATGGSYAEAANPEALSAIFQRISERLSSEYVVTYRSLLPPRVEANVQVNVNGFAAPARASYTTPALNLSPRGTFDREWVDDVITSPWLMVFVIGSVLLLVAFAILSVIEYRRRSLRRRMRQYVSVPSEEESLLRRAEVTAFLAETAQKRVSRLRSWQAFESDVEIAGFKMSALAIAGWTIVGGILAGLVAAIYFQHFAGFLVAFAAPFVTRFVVSYKLRKARDTFQEQLADNLDVLAGAMRTGHAVMGALAVMVDSADEPSKREFRRVLQDENLGVPLEDALMVMARRMESYDAEQVAMVMRLQREAGGNTAEVLDRVAETIRGRMELRRLVNVLTAQAKISRWILTALPVFVLVMLMMSGGDYLDPMFDSTFGIIALIFGAILVLIGSFWIKKIATLDV
jgi:tight adherence protein B